MSLSRPALEEKPPEVAQGQNKGSKNVMLHTNKCLQLPPSVWKKYTLPVVPCPGETHQAGELGEPPHSLDFIFMQGSVCFVALMCYRPSTPRALINSCIRTKQHEFKHHFNSRWSPKLQEQWIYTLSKTLLRGRLQHVMDLPCQKVPLTEERH